MLLAADGITLESPDMERSSISSTMLTLVRRDQLLRILGPIIAAVRGYREDRVLAQMHLGFDGSRAKPAVVLTRDMEGKLYVERLFEDAVAVLRLAGVADESDGGLCAPIDFGPLQPVPRHRLEGIMLATGVELHVRFRGRCGRDRCRCCS